MQQVAATLPSPNDWKSQGTKQSSKTWQTSEQERSKRLQQLKALITQSFQIFNVYGRQAEAVNAIISAFSYALEEYHIDHITAAFQEWMLEQSVMPTPADILKITKILDADEKARLAGFQRAKPAYEHIFERPPWIAELYSGRVKPETMQKFKAFLMTIPEERGRLYCGTLCNYDEIMKYDAADYRIPPFTPRASDTVVPWFGMMWHEMSENLKEEFINHVSTKLEGENKIGYLKFAKTQIGLPLEIYNNLMEFMNAETPNVNRRATEQ